VIDFAPGGVASPARSSPVNSSSTPRATSRWSCSPRVIGGRVGDPVNRRIVNSWNGWNIDCQERGGPREAAVTRRGAARVEFRVVAIGGIRPGETFRRRCIGCSLAPIAATSSFAERGTNIIPESRAGLTTHVMCLHHLPDGAIIAGHFISTRSPLLRNLLCAGFC